MTDPATTRTVPPELSEFTPLEATQQTCGLLIVHLLAQASLEDPELTEVMYSLNALLESLDAINPPGLNDVEPLPIILPPA